MLLIRQCGSGLILSRVTLSALSEADVDLVRPHLRPITLRAQTLLHEPGDRLTHVIFPHDAAIVRGVVLADGSCIMAQLIGVDGVLGAAAADDLCENSRAVVQCEGEAAAIATPALRELCSESQSVKAVLARYRHFSEAQVDWMAACNACHTLEQRLATCILRLGDACGHEVLHVLQDRLAELLGANRTSVSLAASKMHQLDIISVRRGKIELNDRSRLHKLACECYDLVNSLYAELFPASCETVKRAS